MAEANKGPKQDELVAKLVKDAQSPPDTLLLSGHVGASSEEGHTRLYFDPQLSDYVEIPNDAILHTQEIPKDQSPLGGTFLWIKSDAVLIHGKVGPHRLKAKFLEGRIQQEFLKGTQAGVRPPGPGAAPAAISLSGHFCGPSVVQVCPSLHCASLSFFCQPSVLEKCPTAQVACTSFIQCQFTHNQPACNIVASGGFGCVPFDPGTPVQFMQGLGGAHFAAAATPAPQDFTIVCTKVGPACSTQQIHCTLGGPACGISAPPCEVLSAACPTPGCPTQHHPCVSIAAICNFPTPNCPVQTANCPSFSTPCLTHSLPACGASVQTPCVTLHQQACVPSLHVPCPPSVHSPCSTLSVGQCSPSVHFACATISEPACHVTAAAQCVTIVCPVASAAACPPVSLGCPEGGLGQGGFAQAAFAGVHPNITLPNVCLQPHTVVGCVPLHTIVACVVPTQILQCHPTIIGCPINTRTVECLQVTFNPGCVFPTRFCPSGFCPQTIACGQGGFGGGGIAR
jgi:hypothetical protein